MTIQTMVRSVHWPFVDCSRQHFNGEQRLECVQPIEEHTLNQHCMVNCREDTVWTTRVNSVNRASISASDLTRSISTPGLSSAVQVTITIQQLPEVRSLNLRQPTWFTPAAPILEPIGEVMALTSEKSGFVLWRRLESQRADKKPIKICRETLGLGFPGMSTVPCF